MTPKNVWINLKSKFKHIGLPSIYRNLESLVECGILTVIHKTDNNRYYGLCCKSHKTTHHHHIICNDCGRIEEYQGCLLKDIKMINNFKVIDHLIQIEGICQECQG